MQPSQAGPALARGLPLLLLGSRPTLLLSQMSLAGLLLQPEQQPEESC